MEHLVLEQLHEIRKNGFPASSIEAAINTTEFALRENNTGRFPRGLSMMLRAMGAWVYDRDAFECAPPSATRALAHAHYARLLPSEQHMFAVQHWHCPSSSACVRPPSTQVQVPGLQN